MSKKRSFSGGKSFGGGAPNMGNLMSQVQKLQEEMEKTQAALALSLIHISEPTRPY